MSTVIVIILVAAIVFGLCRLVDKAFAKLFRSKAQHMSGLAVRANKRYGLFGVILSALGIMAICAGIKGDRVLLWGGVIVLLMGAGLAAYYLSFGVFYDQDTFLLSKFAKKSVAYRYDQIRGQKLYLIQGGNVVIELYLSDGNTPSVRIDNAPRRQTNLKRPSRLRRIIRPAMRRLPDSPKAQNGYGRADK